MSPTTPPDTRRTADETGPDSPTDLPRTSLVATLRRAAKEFSHDQLTDLAAALTYYGVLSVVPGLIVLISLLGLLGPHATSQLIDQVGAVAPGSSAEVVRTLITQAQSNRTSAGIGAVVGVLVALWSASGYVSAFMRAANRVYGIGEGRPIWKTIPIRLGVTVVAVVVLVVAVALVVVSGPVAHQLGDVVGAGDAAVTVYSFVKWPVLVVLLSVLLAVLFWASPNAKQGGVRWVSPGGFVAVLLWALASALFAVYVTSFSSYDKTYGSLAGVVIFLVWMWVSNIALLLGVEVNAELDHQRAIADGLPDDVGTFAVPRDTRKLDADELADVEQARARRTDPHH